MLGCSMVGCGPAEQATPEPLPAVAMPTPRDALEARVYERAPAEAPMMVPHESMIRGTLERGAERSFTTVLLGGECYKVLGQGGDGVRDLDLFAYSPQGALMQRDATGDDHPALGIDRAICPEEPGAYRIEIEMHDGAGEYAVQVFSSQ